MYRKRDEMRNGKKAIGGGKKGSRVLFAGVDGMPPPTEGGKADADGIVAAGLMDAGII
ncbi:MAG: hypothetical protein SXV54_28170 [Chloroflexota bacterium]|nr:hypothetical protein [Chloroflexota bacterium]